MSIKNYESEGTALKEGIKKTSHIKGASTFEMQRGSVSDIRELQKQPSLLKKNPVLNGRNSTRQVSPNPSASIDEDKLVQTPGSTRNSVQGSRIGGGVRRGTISVTSM